MMYGSVRTPAEQNISAIAVPYGGELDIPCSCYCAAHAGGLRRG